MLTKLFQKLLKILGIKKRRKHKKRTKFFFDVDTNLFLSKEEYKMYKEWIKTIKNNRSLASRSDLRFFFLYIKNARNDLGRKILFGKRVDLFPKFDAYNEMYREMLQILNMEE